MHCSDTGDQPAGRRWEFVVFVSLPFWERVKLRRHGVRGRGPEQVPELAGIFGSLFRHSWILRRRGRPKDVDSHARQELLQGRFVSVTEILGLMVLTGAHAHEILDRREVLEVVIPEEGQLLSYRLRPVLADVLDFSHQGLSHGMHTIEADHEKPFAR